MKSYPKTIDRTFRNNLGRFFAITLIVMLGIAIISGLGALSPITRVSVSNNLEAHNFSDLIVKSTTGSFSQDQIDEISSFDGVVSFQAVSSIDMEIGELNSRIIYMDFKENTVNTLELISGRFPQAQNEIVVERQTDYMQEYSEGDTIEFYGMTLNVVGVVGSPLIYSKDFEPDVINQNPLELIVYIDSSYNFLPFPTKDVYLKLDKEAGINYFTKDYKEMVSAAAQELEETLSFDTVEILTVEENKSYLVTESYTDKVQKISLVFPLFFIAVVILVALTTMTRLIEEERQIIGCYKTLGYGNGKISFKYLIFSAVSCILGCALGLATGTFLIPLIIYPGFNTVLFLPEMASYYNILIGGVVSLGMIAAVCGVTGIIIGNYLKEKPADLLRPKAPKAGKKIFLEKIPFIWNRTKFKYKSTLRNIFRYKKHLIMTLVSVGGSTAIVFAGVALYNATTTSDKLGAVADAVSLISSVIVLFACALCILVIYNLTNMNIGERTREIATLKVLGYHQAEVAGYIYREIFIMSLMGIAIGIPVGCLLVWFLFGYLDIGSIADVSWWVYLLTIAVVIALIGLIDLLLLHKIKKVDMNTSLKMVD